MGCGGEQSCGLLGLAYLELGERIEISREPRKLVLLRDLGSITLLFLYLPKLIVSLYYMCVCVSLSSVCNYIYYLH